MIAIAVWIGIALLALLWTGGAFVLAELEQWVAQAMRPRLRQA